MHSSAPDKRMLCRQKAQTTAQPWGIARVTHGLMAATARPQRPGPALPGRFRAHVSLHGAVTRARAPGEGRVLPVTVREEADGHQGPHGTLGAGLLDGGCGACGAVSGSPSRSPPGSARPAEPSARRARQRLRASRLPRDVT